MLIGNTLPKTNSSNLKNGAWDPKKEFHLNQPLIFRGKLAVSFREGTSSVLKLRFFSAQTPFFGVRKLEFENPSG